VAGKLPSLVRLADGRFVLLTAHTSDHCRVYVSPDGSGKTWSDAFVVTSQSGGNTSMAVTGDDRLVVITPANNRLHAWAVTIRDADKEKAAVAIGPPSQVEVAAGSAVRVSWRAPESAAEVVRYRVTPQLVAASNPDTEVERYAAIETAGPVTQIDLGRVLSIGGRYRFKVEAVDRQGRVSATAESAETVVGLSAPAASR
jgi:hypothetical protein